MIARSTSPEGISMRYTRTRSHTRTRRFHVSSYS